MEVDSAAPSRTPGTAPLHILLRMDRAAIGGAVRDRSTQQGRAVFRAVEARPAGRGEVAGVGAAAASEDAEGVADRPVKSLHLVVGEVAGRSRGIHSSTPEHLVTEEVAEPGGARLVH